MPLKNTYKDLKVLILCGGKGERLRPLTQKIPKPLVLIKGKPILGYLIYYFEKYGFKKFIIATGYKSEKIMRYFDKNHKNLEIGIIDSGDVDIIKRIQDAADNINGDFIMCYGDTLANVDLKKLISFHRAHKGTVTITSFPLQSQFGILELETLGKVKSFREKPTLDKWINIGYFYFSFKSMKYLMESRTFVDFIQKQIENGNMFSYRHTGVHITVNTLKELQEAEKNITRFDYILRR